MFLACHNPRHASTQPPPTTRRIGARARRGGRGAALGRAPRPPVGARGAGGHAGARARRPCGIGPRELPRRPHGRSRRQRLRPARDPARLRLGHDDAHGERARAARVGAGRDREGDRGRARRGVRRLDLQRPHPRPDAALPRGRAATDHVRQRRLAPAHDPLPRHPSGGDGRRARASAPARSRPAAARSTSSTPCPPGCTSTTATSARSRSTSPRGSTARSSSTRRAGARTPTRS